MADFTLHPADWNSFLSIRNNLLEIHMEPLFEAKARVNEQLTLFNVYRLTVDKYKVEPKRDEDIDSSNDAPEELTLHKQKGQWITEDTLYTALGCTIGTEIDVFNNGYGGLLGRIGDR
jgi:hypothetical protein